jgi:hypothetical protein
MGYHLTILRSANGKQLPISLDEAIAATREIGGWAFIESPPTFELRKNERDCTLWYQDGELWAKTPESWELEPMLVLARYLNARVRGDEWETYESLEKTFLHPDDLPLRKDAEAKSRESLSRFQRDQKIARNVIVGFFVVLGVIGYLIGRWMETK